MAEGVDITKAHVPLVYVVVIVGAIVGAAWAVCTTYNKQTFEVQLLRERIEGMATKADLTKQLEDGLNAIRAHDKERVQFYLEHAALRVSTVPGKHYMRGKIEWPIKLDDEP
jgi:hypothetical protein